jgi:hypothetical protein
VREAYTSRFADSDEAGHASQFGSGHPYRNEAGQRTDLKPATPVSDIVLRVEEMMVSILVQVKRMSA